METVWVTAQYVNDPKPTNPRNGTIKDPVQGYISVPAEQLGLFQKGRRYCIIMQTTDRGFKNFRGFAQQAPEPTPAQTFDGRQPQQLARPAPRQITPRGIPAGSFQAQADPTAMNIFITGLVGRALGSGHFAAADIDELTRAAKESFLKHLSGRPEKSVPDDSGYNDPLPDPSQYGAAPPDDSDNIPY